MMPSVLIRSRVCPRATSSSPRGPAGISNEVVRHFSGSIPILGVCLGHQCIGYVNGGVIGRASPPMHGKSSEVHHDGRTIFSGLPDPFVGGRYHSLVVEAGSFSDSLEVTGL